MVTAVSRLTDDSDDDVDEEDESEKSSKCPRCGGEDMRTKESRGWGFGKTTSLVCEACGLERRRDAG